jgi:alpha-tubulin suppressor-like RCC1 family protein
VPGLTGVTEIAAGKSHTCALLVTGKIKCWGKNTSGQLGNGGVFNSLSPVDVLGFGPDSLAVGVAVGESHSCATLANGNVKCWGSNNNGQVGFLPVIPQPPVTTPVLVKLFNGARATAVSAGGDNACAVIVDGQVQCWGRTYKGKPFIWVPQPLTLDDGVMSLSLGYQHGCAVLINGLTDCWGANTSAQTGSPASVGSFPHPVLGLSSSSRAVSISAGSVHSCLLMRVGHLQCWGSNSSGQLGAGQPGTFSSTPVDVQPDNWIALSAGRAHTCILAVNGKVSCMGANAFGQLGNGTTQPFSNPTLVVGLSQVRAVASGDTHSCAIVSDSVWCWGANDSGQLGDGTTVNSTAPRQVSGLGRAKSITAGSKHTCVVLADSSVRCWGANTQGQLGNGTTIRSLTPTTVKFSTGSILTRVVAVDASVGTGDGGHTCALLASGTVRCWGANNRGQLGNGSSSNSSSPVVVAQLSGATSIAVGGLHTCAVLVAGTARCWGANGGGQLGVGSTLDSNLPAPVQGFGSAVRVLTVSVGFSHSCAVDTVGVVRCWGFNSAGQLGNGVTSASLTPVLVSGQ